MKVGGSRAAGAQANPLVGPLLQNLEQLVRWNAREIEPIQEFYWPQVLACCLAYSVAAIVSPGSYWHHWHDLLYYWSLSRLLCLRHTVGPYSGSAVDRTWNLSAAASQCMILPGHLGPWSLTLLRRLVLAQFLPLISEDSLPTTVAPEQLQRSRQS